MKRSDVGIIGDVAREQRRWSSGGQGAGRTRKEKEPEPGVPRRRRSAVVCGSKYVRDI